MSQEQNLNDFIRAANDAATRIDFARQLYTCRLARQSLGGPQPGLENLKALEAELKYLLTKVEGFYKQNHNVLVARSLEESTNESH